MISAHVMGVWVQTRVESCILEYDTGVSSFAPTLDAEATQLVSRNDISKKLPGLFTNPNAAVNRTLNPYLKLCPRDKESS